MRNLTIAPPALAFVMMTRAALAAGIGLLLADRLPAGRRRTLGKTLVAIGAATTVPAILLVRRSFRRSTARSAVAADARLIGATRFPRKGDDID